MVRVGVVGYGHLGQYLVESITKHQDLELAWVWNRSPIHGKVEEKFILKDLADCAKNNPDVIVEVAHPDITRYSFLYLVIKIFINQFIKCQKVRAKVSRGG